MPLGIPLLLFCVAAFVSRGSRFPDTQARYAPLWASAPPAAGGR